MNKCFSDDEINALVDEMPIGRLGTPGEMADMVYELTKAPLYLTGQIIGFDGGYI